MNRTVNLDTLSKIFPIAVGKTLTYAETLETTSSQPALDPFRQNSKTTTQQNRVEVKVIGTNTISIGDCTFPVFEIDFLSTGIGTKYAARRKVFYSAEIYLALKVELEITQNDGSQITNKFDYKSVTH